MWDTAHTRLQFSRTSSLRHACTIAGMLLARPALQNALPSQVGAHGKENTMNQNIWAPGSGMVPETVELLGDLITVDEPPC